MEHFFLSVYEYVHNRAPADTKWGLAGPRVKIFFRAFFLYQFLFSPFMILDVYFTYITPLFPISNFFCFHHATPINIYLSMLSIYFLHLAKKSLNYSLHPSILHWESLSIILIYCFIYAFYTYPMSIKRHRVNFTTYRRRFIDAANFFSVKCELVGLKFIFLGN